MTWQRPGRGQGHGGASDSWSKSDQHRFEDRLDKRLEQIEASIDRLSTRQAWIGGAVALALVALGVAVRFIGGS